MQAQKKRQLGIGLLELMLSLAIIAVLLVMATRYYESANHAQTSNQALSFIQAVEAAGASYLAGHTGYSNLSQTNICAEGYLPKPFCQSPADQAPTGPFGDAINIASASAEQFTLSIPHVSAAVCANLKSKLSAGRISTTCPTSGSTQLDVVMGDVA